MLPVDSVEAMPLACHYFGTPRGASGHRQGSLGVEIKELPYLQR